MPSLTLSVPPPPPKESFLTPFIDTQATHFRQLLEESSYTVCTVITTLIWGSLGNYIKRKVWPQMARNMTRGESKDRVSNNWFFNLYKQLNVNLVWVISQTNVQTRKTWKNKKLRRTKAVTVNLSHQGYLLIHQSTVKDIVLFFKWFKNTMLRR